MSVMQVDYIRDLVRMTNVDPAFIASDLGYPRTDSVSWISGVTPMPDDALLRLYDMKGYMDEWVDYWFKDIEFVHQDHPDEVIAHLIFPDDATLWAFCPELVGFPNSWHRLASHHLMSRLAAAGISHFVLLVPSDRGAFISKMLEEGASNLDAWSLVNFGVDPAVASIPLSKVLIV